MSGERRVLRATDHESHRWAVVGGVGLVILGIAVATRTATITMIGAICIVYAGYAQVVTPPALWGTDEKSVLTLDRIVDEPDPVPGTAVTVTVVVENTSDQLVTDFRVVDAVSTAVNVVDGSPRHSDVLAPGGRTAFSYTVVASPGEFDWGTATAVVADPSGSIERELELEAPFTLACADGDATSTTQTPPLQPLATPYPGRIAIDEGGDGIEFHARRDYQPADPLSRIDWKHLAKTGEFATIEHRRERLARVMLVIDSRYPSYVAPEPTAPHAVERSVAAASILFEILLDAGDQVGFTTYGPWDDCWFDPHSGTQHRSRGRNLFETHPAFAPEPPEHGLYEWLPPEREEEVRQKRAARFHHRLAPSTQIVFFSPCCDDHTTSIVQELHAYGHPVTMISPDPTAAKTAAHELARLERTDRLADLRSRGVRILDWSPDEPFDIALSNAIRRWNA